MLLLANMVIAQDTPFSIMTSTSMYLNPACTGVINRDVKAGLIYRSQGSSIAKPYTTFGASAEMAYYHNKDKSNFFGFGINAFQHKEGLAAIKHTSANISASYTIGLSSSLSDFLTVGLQGGIAQRAMNLDNSLRWDSQWTGLKYDAKLTGEYFDIRNFNYYDFGAGVLYNKKISNQIKLNGGFSAYHIGGPKISMNEIPKGPSGALADKLHRKYTVHGSAEIFTSQNSITVLVPSFVYQQQRTQKNVMIGLDLRYLVGVDSKFTDYNKQTAISVGMSYRLKDALIPHVRMDYKEFTFYTSYDITVSKLSSANKSSGAYEFAMVWNIKTALSTKNKPRIFKFVN